MSALDSLGSIANQFKDGFRSSQVEGHRQSIEDAQLAYDRAGRLFQMADQVQDPRMKDALFSSATHLVDAASTPGAAAKKPNPKGFGSILGQLFGIGHVAPPHPSVIGEPAAAQPSPFAGSPIPPAGSNTSGSIAQQFGPEVMQNPGADAPAVSALPDVPLPLLEKAGAPGAIIDTPWSPKNTPREMAMIMAGIPLHEEGAPAAQVSPIAAQFPGGQTPAGPAPASSALNFPSVVDIRRRAIADTASPQYGFRDQYKQSLAEQDHASTIARTLFSTMDAHLKENPAVTTLAAADKDPSFGSEFRQTMDAIAQYEDAGMLPKGTLENWQKQRFDDVRFGSDKFSPSAEADQYAKTVETPDGKRMGFNPKTNAYDIPIGGSKPVPPNEFLQAALNKDPAKRTPEESAAVENSYVNTPEGRLRQVLGKDVKTWTPAERTLVDGEKARLAQIEDSRKSQVDKVKDAAISELLSGKPGENVRALKAYEPIIQPPPVPITGTGVGPTGQNGTYILDRGTNKVTWTGITQPSSPFISERYMTDIPKMEPRIKADGTPLKNIDGTPALEAKGRKSVYDVTKLIGAYQAHDPSISLDFLNSVLATNQELQPGDREKLSKFIEDSARLRSKY